MKKRAVVVGTFTLSSASLLLLATGWGQRPSSPLASYGKLEFPPKDENFDKGWKERVALEYEIINGADLPSLRTGIKDPNPFVRAMAARALGILGDKASADALAELVRVDPEYLVRIRAVESLGLLKMNAEAIELAKEDRDRGVQWVAELAARLLQQDTDYAALARKAYAVGIKREAMGSAKVGHPAPDFTAQTCDGKTFKLSAVLGKPIALYFAAFDG
jgi:hypothetical protein